MSSSAPVSAPTQVWLADAGRKRGAAHLRCMRDEALEIFPPMHSETITGLAAVGSGKGLPIVKSDFESDCNLNRTLQSLESLFEIISIGFYYSSALR